MRAIRRTIPFLMTAAACGLGAIVSCARTSPAPSPVGSVGLAVRVSNQINFSRVDFQISGNGITPITGFISVADPSATASQFLSGLPAGRGYAVKLTGTSTDGQTNCAGTAHFDISDGGSTSVNVLMQCRASASEAGTVVVVGGVNNCPSLRSVVVSPASTALGGTISVSATAVDLDVGDMLSFEWTATAGSFAMPAASQTTFNCSGEGNQTVSISVSDGRCTDAVDVGVACVPPECGNRVLDPAEECDPPAPGICDPMCLRIPICGDGIIEKTEQCDPPRAGTCDATCRTISAGTGGAGGSGGGGTGGGGGP